MTSRSKRVNKTFLISFEYHLDNGKIAIPLRAEVDRDNRGAYYIVRNIGSIRQGNAPAIKELRITKKASMWVHFDSLRPTDLTSCIGKAIDALELKAE
ncbi:MAG TPA: hypothetical protein VL978_02825 [Puia sp.]|nr:hypothetical protein [Puia sp.]